MSKDFSLDNFKKWMDEQTEEVQPPTSIIGLEVQSKLNGKKLLSRMTLEDGDRKEVCLDFIENGGKIKEELEKQFLIEVASGSFYLHRMYVDL